MKLTDIPEQAVVFIDANIFIYHFVGASLECKKFLSRCAQKEISGVTSSTVLAEVCHRLMIIEALKFGKIRPQKPLAQLQKKPHIVKGLAEYFIQVTNILSWKIQILSPSEDIVMRSQIFRRQFGLLTNDSFIPVFMADAGTVHLASADQAFGQIPRLQLYAPSDIS